MSLEWAERIRGLRESLDLTQEEFAGLFDVDHSFVSLLERGIQEPTVCWKRIIQFLHDCTSNAYDILGRKPWLRKDARWGDRVLQILRSLDWTREQLAKFMGVWNGAISQWIYEHEQISGCHQILISLLEIYSDVDKQQWPPGLYFEPEDIISKERVRLLRLALGMKQSQLGNVLHVKHFTVSGWETGHYSPGWCGNLLLRVIEAYPRAIDLLERIPWSDERVFPERAKQIREALGLTVLELAHFLGASLTMIQHNERAVVRDAGCSTLIYLLLEKYPDEFIPLVEGLSSPGGQACPIW